MTPEYFLIPIIITQVNQVISIMNTGNIIIDGLLFIMFYLMYKNVNFMECLHKLREKLRLKKINTIILTSECNEQTINLKAVIYYITAYSKNAHTIREVVPKSVYYDENSNEVNGSYIIDQVEEFIINNNISGILRKNKKNTASHAGGTTYIEIEVTTLSIFSEKNSLYELREWINSCVKDYRIYLKTIYNESQLYVTISKPESRHNKIEAHDGKRRKKVDCYNELIIESIPWVSNITFSNSYFNDMDNIINNIDFFLKNEEWYIKKGIPYNLGILLYGEPGCGKTRFIKQLMNHTKRHCIDIKLTDTMCYKDLCNILLKEEIDNEIMIPINNRILVFEDIDALCDSVKSRDANDKDTLTAKNDSLNNIPKITELNKTEILLHALLEPTNESSSISAKLSLSYLLNMLDGINESSGRIIIMTSNKPDVLDKALIRPGRIDLKIHFNKCSRFDIMKMINLFWELELSTDDLLDSIEMIYSSAEVYNIFRSARTFDDIRHMFIKINIIAEGKRL